MLGKFCRCTEIPSGYNSSTAAFDNSCAGYSAADSRAEHRTTSRSRISGGSHGSCGCDRDSSGNYDCDASCYSDYGGPSDCHWPTYANHDEGGRPHGDAHFKPVGDKYQQWDNPGFSHHCGTTRFATGSAECSSGTAVYLCARSIGCCEYEHGFDQHEFKRCELGWHEFHQPGCDSSELRATREFSGCSERAAAGESRRGSNASAGHARAARSHSCVSSGHGPK